MARAKPDFYVTGPGVECKAESAGVGLSLATTYATRADSEATYYVRDRAGDPVGHAERDADGVVRIYRRRR